MKSLYSVFQGTSIKICCKEKQWYKDGLLPTYIGHENIQNITKYSAVTCYIKTTINQIFRIS